MSLLDNHGYRLWLRYDAVRPPLLERFRAALRQVICEGRSPVLDAASTKPSRLAARRVFRP